MSEELLPCPFCGSNPNTILRPRHDEHDECEYAYHEIECTNRDCGVCPIVNEDLKEEDGENAWALAIDRAVTAWNRRAPLATQPETEVNPCPENVGNEKTPGSNAAPTGPIPADAATNTANAIRDYLRECSNGERWPDREVVEEIFRTNFAPLCPLNSNLRRELTQALKERDEMNRSFEAMLDNWRSALDCVAEEKHKSDSLRAQLAAVTQERDNLAAAYAYVDAELAKRDKEKEA